MQIDQGEGGVHPNHLSNRIAYAERIIAWLDEFLPEAKAENLAVVNAPTWERIAVKAGETIAPSSATISTIVGMIKMRENVLAQVAKVTGGAKMFDRLPERRLMRETV